MLASAVTNNKILYKFCQHKQILTHIKDTTKLTIYNRYMLLIQIGLNFFNTTQTGHQFLKASYFSSNSHRVMWGMLKDHKEGAHGSNHSIQRFSMYFDKFFIQTFQVSRPLFRLNCSNLLNITCTFNYFNLNNLSNIQEYGFQPISLFCQKTYKLRASFCHEKKKCVCN